MGRQVIEERARSRGTKAQLPGLRTAMLVFAALTLLTACGKKATYSVKGTGTATITYRDGDMKTVDGATLPWSADVTGKTFDLSATGTGTLTCDINVEGQGSVGNFGTGHCLAGTTAR